MTMSIRAIEGGSYAVTDASGATRIVDADEIRRIANSEVMAAYDRVTTALAAFQDLQEGSGVFGGSSPAAELASLHASVKGVFVSTVDGVGTDLDTFGTNLIKGADNWDLADQTSAERCARLSELVQAGTAGPLAGDQSYDDSRYDAGESLQAGEELSARQEQIRQEQEQAAAAQTEAATQGESGNDGTW